MSALSLATELRLKASKEATIALLNHMIKDQRIKKRFFGTISKGKIEGFYYGPLAKEHDTSLLRITGNYFTEKGEINLMLKPSNVFYIILGFAVAGQIVLICAFIFDLTGITFFLIFPIITALIAMIQFPLLAFQKRKFGELLKDFLSREEFITPQ